MKKAPAPERAKLHAHSNYTTTSTYAERLDAIRAALLNAGIEPHNMDALLSRLVDTDSQIIRTGTASKPGSKNVWAIAYHDRGLPFVVVAGDWSTGAETKWIAAAGETLSLAEQRELKRRMADARKARELGQARQHEQAAAKAARAHRLTQPMAICYARAYKPTVHASKAAS
jgi:putative DNA primase/helicase